MSNPQTMTPECMSVTQNNGNGKYLIIEDEPDLNNLIAEIVQLGGYGVVKAYNCNSISLISPRN